MEVGLGHAHVSWRGKRQGSTVMQAYDRGQGLIRAHKLLQRFLLLACFPMAAVSSLGTCTSVKASEGRQASDMQVRSWRS